jgi:prolyl oligopeptidase
MCSALPCTSGSPLQEAGGERPVLLRVGFDAGHGMGLTKAQRVLEASDIYGFLLRQLGSEAVGTTP